MLPVLAAGGGSLDGRLCVLGEVSIHDRCRVLRQHRDALGDGTAWRNWRMDHRDSQLSALDQDFRT
jgi:hypothetical protein